ncbi:unnamed protein product [Phytophthora fragariaefolia]|uniref:Unnamed protein product n=1 Tax=Phytophthora fragariaefolia TaxID=1490495 RepID=A0A9W6WWJ7_9STRA|nr:unnamed protein product [Phytophthora fragariaefolia]
MGFSRVTACCNVGNKMGFSRVTACCNVGNKSVLLAALGFIFVILNLAALWALHFADRPVTTGSLRSVTRFSSDLLGSSGATPQVGDAVSLNSDNVLRTGAGTTGYLNKLTLDSSAKSIDYIYFAPMGTSESYYPTNVLSYVVTNSDATTKNIVTTVTYDATNKSLTVADVDETNNLAEDKVRGLATLSDTKMAVLTYYVAADWKTKKTSVMSATLDGSTGKVTLNKDKLVKVTDTSATNFISRLSSSAFIVTYYNAADSQGEYYQVVKVGTIATDGTITLTAAAVDFGVANSKFLMTTFGYPLALKTLATTTGIGFVIPYFNSINTWATGNTKTDADLVGLCVTSSTFLVTTLAVDTFSDPVCNTAYRPTHFLDSVALSDDTMVIIFIDAANSNAITLATVKVSSTSLTFRTSYVLDVYGDFDFGKGYEFWTTPRLRVLSGNRLAVSFLNPKLTGRLSTQVLSFSVASLTFKELTPILPVALSNFTLATSDAAKSGAVTHDLLPVGPDSFVAAYVGNRDDVLHQNFSVLEMYSKPVGIVQSYSDGSASVATQGRVDVDGLTSGAFHYATTSGSIVAKDCTSSTSNSTEFIYAAGDTVLVTTDSRVGMAIDDNTLFVSTTF